MTQQHDSIIAHDILLGSRNTPAKPSLAFGDGDSGFYEAQSNQIYVALNGTETWKFLNTEFGSSLASCARLANVESNATTPGLIFRNDEDTGVGHAAANALSLIAGGSEVLRLTTAGLIIQTVDVPANAADTGVAGQIAWDASFFYVCVAANSWTRVAIAAW